MAVIVGAGFRLEARSVPLAALPLFIGMRQSVIVTVTVAPVIVTWRPDALIGAQR